MGLEYYIVDVETTGLSTKIHEVSEISVIRAVDRMQLTEFIKCEKPETASYDALQITGKTLDDLVKGNSKEFVVAKIDKFLNEDGLTPAHRCFVGHNVNFDRKFIFSLYEKVGKTCPANLWLDTLALTKEFIKKYDTSQLNIVKTATGRISTTLHACCDMLSIKRFAAAHASKVDTRNTYLLWRKLIEEKGIDHLPFHKTFVHYIKKDDELEDIDSLDMSDVM
jgi:DNA polymerase III alpha subunit (gram-positive type)